MRAELATSLRSVKLDNSSVCLVYISDNARVRWPQVDHPRLKYGLRVPKPDPMHRPTIEDQVALLVAALEPLAISRVAAGWAALEFIFGANLDTMLDVASTGRPKVLGELDADELRAVEAMLREDRHGDAVRQVAAVWSFGIASIRLKCEAVRVLLGFGNWLGQGLQGSVGLS